MENKTKILLVGKAGSGKDYFRDYLIDKGYRTSVSHTTRPMRDGEKDGLTYYFVSTTEFNYLLLNDVFFENKRFNGWDYGTSRREWNASSVFIFTPGGIESLPKEVICTSIIIFFNIPDDVRIKRMIERSDADSVERRIISDDLDFKNFTNYDIEITDPLFDCEQLLEQIKMYTK